MPDTTKASEKPIGKPNIPPGGIEKSVDLVLQKAWQTSPDLWIIQVRNVGLSNAAATQLAVRHKTPPSAPGQFPAGSTAVVGPYPVPAIKAGGETKVTVKLGFKTKPKEQYVFEVNADHAIPELNYKNNSKTETSNPGYL